MDLTEEISIDTYSLSSPMKLGEYNLENAKNENQLKLKRFSIYDQLPNREKH